MDSVISLICFTQSAALTAFSTCVLIVSYIEPARSIAEFADSPSAVALSEISSESLTPSLESFAISDAPCLMSPMFCVIVPVVAEVSCMPAANCSVVAELSIHCSRICSLTSFTLLTSSQIFWLESFKFIILWRRLSLIPATDLPIKPTSSRRSAIFFTLPSFVKSSLAVSSITSVRLSSGRTIKTTANKPTKTLKTIPMTATEIPRTHMEFETDITSLLSAVITKMLLSLSTWYAAYFISPLNSYVAKSFLTFSPFFIRLTTSFTTAFSTDLPTFDSVGWKRIIPSLSSKYAYEVSNPEILTFLKILA